MQAFNLGKVQGARITTNQQAAGEGHFRQAVEPSFGNGPCAVSYPFAAFQVLAEHRVVFHALKFIERGKPRVLVTEVHNQAHYHLLVFRVVEEPTAVGVAV